MAFCTYCGKSFQRNEHLERHLATHTNIKRFKCQTCHISFSRRDVLRKHMYIHGDTNQSADRDTNENTRPRTQTACRSCAKMKAKCDANSPCARCLARQIPCDRPPRAKTTTSSSTATQQQQSSGTASTVNGCSSMDGSMGDDGGSLMDVGDDDAVSASSAVAIMESVSEEINAAPGPARNSRSSLSAPTSLSGPQQASSASREDYTAAFSVDPRPSYLEFMSDSGHDFGALDGNTDESPSGQRRTMLLSGASDDSAIAMSSYPYPDKSMPNIPDLYQDSIIVNTDMPSEDLHHQMPDIVLANDWGDDSNNNNNNGSNATAGQNDGQCDQSPLFSIEPPDHLAIVSAQKYWYSFVCNPRLDVVDCPRTGGVLLESLSHMPESDNLWGWLDFGFPSPESFGDTTSVPLQESVRDRLSAISQSFLRKALSVHKLDPVAAASSTQTPTSPDVSPGFLILPPAATLEHFLREYMRLFDPFYSLVPGRVLDANALVNGGSSAASTLLLLLMIAQGAMSDPTGEARRLSGGLTEVCRIALFDMIEKAVCVCHHRLLVHSALLFVVQAAWSGDKWLMDIGLGQRGIYIAIIRHGGLLDIPNQESTPPPETLQQQPDAAWSRWLEAETRSRLAYAWVTLDLELSLFLDVNPLITIAELKTSLPDREELWLATDHDSWAHILSQNGRTVPEPQSQQPSLRTLFRWFMNDDLRGPREAYLTPSNLRLLLHPLHALVHTHRQLLDCFEDEPDSQSYTYSPVSKRSCDVRMEEIQGLLQRWLVLYKSSCARQTTTNANSQQQNHHAPNAAGLVTYHTLSLNAVASVKEIEQLAQRRISDNQLRQLSPHIADRCIRSPGEALKHAGQILYCLRSMGRKSRPPWWPAALYRATLVLWACSVFHGSMWKSASAAARLAIDDDVPQFSGSLMSPVIVVAGPGNTIEKRAIPTLTSPSGLVALDDPICIIETCLLAFGDAVATRLSEGIRSKLKEFGKSRCILRDGQ